MVLNVTAADLQRIQSSDLASCVPTAFGINLHLHFRWCEPRKGAAGLVRARKHVQATVWNNILMRAGPVRNAPRGHFFAVRHSTVSQSYETKSFGKNSLTKVCS